jgi:hypothetical protein
MPSKDAENMHLAISGESAMADLASNKTNIAQVANVRTHSSPRLFFPVGSHLSTG